MVVQETEQNKSEFTTVGIDQALRNVGLCVNKNGRLSGMLIREMKLRGSERLDSLENQITMYVKVFHPELIAMEGYSFGSINRPFDLGEIGGILKLSFRRLGIPVIIVAPSLLKKFVAGDGSASKARVIGYVNTKYSYDTNNDNVADAVGLAKFAEVYLTGKSSYRSELDAVLALKESLCVCKVPVKFRKLPSI
jgi:Holliday junction resolvasome RuvABC endonuclease subunit